jgi:long-chain acyl-CoA synthetase
MTLLYEWLERATSESGNAKALVYRDNYLSWRGLKHRADRRAQEFHAMGIKPGEWVGLMLGNVADFVILALGLSKVGAAIVPIDPTTSSREFELVLDTVPLRALITRPRGTDGAASSSMPSDFGPRKPVARASTSPGFGASPASGRRSLELPESRRRLQGTLLTCSMFKRATPALDVKPDVVMFTADSAGDPRAVLRTRKNLEAQAKILAASLEVVADTKILTAVPLFHAYGWDFGLLTALRQGATLNIEEELSAKRVAKILREQEVDVLPGTPTLFAGLSKIPVAKPLRKKGLRYLAAGGRLEESVAESFRERYGVRLMNAYHTTETGAVAIDLQAKNPESVGKVLDGMEVRLSNTDGGKLPSGERGVIWVRGPSVAERAIGPYAIPPPPSGRVQIGGRDGDGWFRTGDLGRVDKSGRLYLDGREDDLVKVDGKRVALGEVEGCLESFHKVKQAQAMVITDPLGGPMVIARVVAAAKCQAEEIIDHCAKNLAPYKVPRRIEFCERLS